MKLTSAKIKNFKSLGEVDLTFRDLTIIVGSNSSGKSNSLEALRFFNLLVGADSFPPLELMERYLRFNQDGIDATLTVEEDGTYAEYRIFVTADKRKTTINQETLKVNGIDIIQILNGQGEVSDEDGGNNQRYQSDPETLEGLALRSAGNFGNKPFTRKLASYIKNWEFYDVDPDSMRQTCYLIERFKGISERIKAGKKTPSLDADAGQVQELLNYWAENKKEKLEEISKELHNCLNISLVSVGEEEKIVNVLEGDGKKIPLSSMSDGTLRLMAYLSLLYQSDLPPLISIEEPERNLHPGILKDVAAIMKRLSRRTQVVFTTHSSQLLDCFQPDEISSEISVILLSKKDDSGTKSFLLDQLAEKRDDLLDWMNDFGLGSAIYHSHLIEEILGTQNA